MSKPQTFPDVTKPLAMLSISLRLGALVPNDNSIIIAIAVGLESGQIADTIAMVKDMIRDSKRIMLDILGDDLLTDIENF